MLIQFKNLILSLFMATNTAVATPVAIESIDNIKEMTCLSQAIYGEASNQSLDGKLAVANVIVNRTKDSKFPSDICSVIRQKNQFYFLRAVKWLNVNDPKVKSQMTDSIIVADMVLNKNVKDNTKGSLYFENPKIATDRAWLSKMKLTVKIQDHIFYKHK